MLRYLRQQQTEQGMAPPAARWGLRLWGALASRPALYRRLTGIGVAILGRMGRRHGRFANLPLAKGWTQGREMPAPQGRTFQAMWRAGDRP
jgi:L-lactate dehydrogenase complex protein LldF